MVKLLLLPLVLLLNNCSGTKPGSPDANKQKSMEQPSIKMQQEQKTSAAVQIPIVQGIVGQVVWQAGNQMPSPDAPEQSAPRGVKRSVYIYELTNTSQTTTINGVFHTNIQTNLVTQVVTGADGSFAVQLEPGMYSIFTKEDKGLYANLFDDKNNIYPVEVKKGQVTKVEFLINYKAYY